ncbi:MAG: M23 family metallopeptidase [Bacteroidales bacterium]|nr:M23 family metallopeptidase [Bacteroidales bacterium]
MRKKVYYRYNSQTENYERVFPSRSSRIWSVLWQLLIAVLVGIGSFFVLDGFIEMPKDKALKSENVRLISELQILRSRMDDVQAVLTDLAERDNNFYRVMLQTNPISQAHRYAGIERTKLSSVTDNELVSMLNAKMAMLEREIVVQSRSFDELRDLAKKSSDRLSHIPAIQPISGNNLKKMASGYGRRTDPIYGTVKMHEGMDFACDTGTPVYATGDGTIKSAKWHSGYGNVIEIDHGFGYTTRYAHMSKFQVSTAQKVKRGDLIGYSGNTGKSTGPHLHYEVRLRGVPQNPVNYYFYDLSPEEYDAMIAQSENTGNAMD